MRLRTLLALLAAVSVAAMVIVTFVLPDPPEVRRGPDRAGSGLGQREGGAGSAATVSDRSAGGRASLAGWPVAELDVRLREVDGRGVSGVALRLESEIGPHLEEYEMRDWRDVVLDATTDGEGAGRFGSLPVGPYAIVAESPDGRRVRREFVLAIDRGDIEVVLPGTPTWRDLLVRVVDASGAVIAGARVDVFGGVLGAKTAAVSEEPALTARSDEAGIARFEKVELEGGVILARHPDGRSAVVRIEEKEDVDRAMEQGGIVVTLARPGTLQGSLNGLPAEHFPEARVIAFALDNSEAYLTTHGAVVSTPVVDDKYRFDALPAGTWTLSLSDPGGARLVLPALRVGPASLPNSVDPIEVEVPSGSSILRDLEVVEGGTIEGIVLTDQGAAIVGALVRDTYAPSTQDFPDGLVLDGVNVWRFDSQSRSPGDHPVTHASTRTDPGGRYRLVGVPPGRHRLEVLAPGFTYDRREGLEVEDGRGTNLEHVLEPAGTIQGVEPRAGILGVTREGREDVLMMAILPDDGRFTFAGLAPGRHVLSRFHSDPGQPRAALATVEVVAGRTTWIDLSRIDPPVRFLGRVLDGKGTVPGVRVRVYPEIFTTDAEGRFEMRSSFPLAGPISVQVLRDTVETWYSLPGIPPGTTTYEKELVLGDEAIRVRTIDASGSPTPARLEIGTTRLRPPLGQVETVRFDPIFVDESGERTVAGLLPGEYTVRARFENGSETQGSASPPETDVLELRMPPSGDLTVQVREPGGGPALGRWVSVETWIDGRASGGTANGREPRPSRDPGLRWGETDVDGRVTFRGVGAGEVLVRVRASRGGRSGLDGTLAEERVTISQGEEKSIELELPEH